MKKNFWSRVRGYNQFPIEKEFFSEKRFTPVNQLSVGSFRFKPHFFKKAFEKEMMFTKHILLHISRTETKTGTHSKMLIERKRDGERTIPVANEAMVVNKRSHAEPS